MKKEQEKSSIGGLDPETRKILETLVAIDKSIKRLAKLANVKLDD